MRHVGPKEYLWNPFRCENIRWEAAIINLTASISISLRYTHMMLLVIFMHRHYIHRRIMGTVTQLLKHLPSIRQAPFGSNIGQGTGCPKWVTHCLPQSLQETFRITTLLGRNRFLPDPFPFNIHSLVNERALYHLSEPLISCEAVSKQLHSNQWFIKKNYTRQVFTIKGPECVCLPLKDLNSDFLSDGFWFQRKRGRRWGKKRRIWYPIGLTGSIV
jgi:hypothetical protein